MIELHRLLKSFSHALRGVGVVFKTEQSFRIQIGVAILVLFLALFFRIQAFEWIILFLLVGSVLILELINSIFERIVDTFKPRIHPVVKDIKDIMAGAVLLGSLISLFIGIVIFLPHVLELVRSFA
ncbi:diacylglycerol kinase family protein [Candidatus Uhrbacteria bacterium]|nr:diacylglycerol kinase family protein [Candidatus Uhrbacteria bacterium]